MRLTMRFFTIFLIGSVLMGACNMPGSISASESGLEVTQTLQALSTEVEATLAAAAPSEPVPPASKEAPTETATLEATATTTLTPTVTPTETPAAPMAHVNTNTNCRSGPSTAFDQLYVAVAGEDLKIAATSTFSDYVLVENPRKAGNDCWLWTQYVDLSGDLSGLPVATPPPTPTPAVDFEVSYTHLEACTGWFPELKVVNTGGVTFKSAKVVMQDKDTKVAADATTNSFSQLINCTFSPWDPELAPGKNGYLYVTFNVFDLNGHKLAATVTLCTEDNLLGTCISKQIQFTA